ncbi:putative bifunctional diguanylate cyclase/phosphodiesterase [Rhizobium sp. PAMB 3182]
MSVISCITGQHNLWLVGLAAVICAFGSFITFRLFLRGSDDSGLLKLGWQFLASMAAGSSIWSTHFIAMLAYKSGGPVFFEPVLTIVSLLVAICGMFIGLTVASLKSPLASVAGGVLCGGAIVAMHYTGMMGYRIDGLLAWNTNYVVASIVLAITISPLAFLAANSETLNRKTVVATGLFVVAIVALHFTGMTALEVTPMVLRAPTAQGGTLVAMAFAVALAVFAIVGTGLTTFVLDDRNRRESFRRINHLAHYDSLTGLANRQNFSDHLEMELSRAQDEGSRFVLITFDLDRFKEINDIRGHGAGDQLLCVLGDRLKRFVDEDHFVARLGGDEFAAIGRLDNQKLAYDFMAQIKAEICKPVRLQGGTDVSVNVSLGAAFYPADGDSSQDLVNNADLAMRRAKSDITRSICFYDASMDEAVRSRKELMANLRQAIELEQFEVFYQVQTSVSTGAVRGYEALLRWKHPVRGYVPPSEFIPIAEESGMILAIGEWVLLTACQQAVTWPAAAKIAVNLSPLQFADRKLPATVAGILQRTGLPAERLELELTETTIVQDRQRTLDMLKEIKALGVTIALDDFGTGYSSLETLRAFPFDKIKLDRSFMSEIESDQQARAIIRAVLALGKSLDIPILAEGVETRNQLDILNHEGCDAAQGYLLGRPAPMNKIREDDAARAQVIDRQVARLQSVLADGDNVVEVRAAG